MKMVWKRALNPHESGAEVLDLPQGAKIVHVAAQHGCPTIWFEVGDAALYEETPHDPRTFAVRLTGHQVDESWLHVGTCILSAGHIVLHVYEVPA